MKTGNLQNLGELLILSCEIKKAGLVVFYIELLINMAIIRKSTGRMVVSVHMCKPIELAGLF